MATSDTQAELITATNLTEYFKASVDEALEHQQIEAHQSTVFYLVSLLTHFARTDHLFDRTPDGVMLRPLASIYADAVEELSPDGKRQALRRLGDIALFISGVFAESLNRKIVDIDYYIAMGGTAYGSVAESMRGTARGAALCVVFDELSDKFTAFVDVLGEVGMFDGSLADHGGVVEELELAGLIAGVVIPYQGEVVRDRIEELDLVSLDDDRGGPALVFHAHAAARDGIFRGAQMQSPSRCFSGLGAGDENRSLRFVGHDPALEGERAVRRDRERAGWIGLDPRAERERVGVRVAGEWDHVGGKCVDRSGRGELLERVGTGPVG